ncbi:MAG TPA: type I DNA topoisomerase [Candidatus Paceibacterota bacterium]|jgi:DNA topoisomerase-1|nr:DNA topoisomerase I [Parcubacteria group bacterium]MDP6119506.1 type I DNA topoisomerase [Candidatus Paceibacterota bacterium]HJN63068.1 type I DNA topoisomerase [Candidatus Paceibacterota bacterium]|tara:strand:+ start:4599 stop:6752 length:2154 start_codon:yes stop_codon:yes gene_type:complete
MKLLIVESPAKAKTITKYLDDKYKVVASVGHIRDLPKNNKKAIDIDGGFLPHYEIKQEKKKVVSELKKLAKDADEIVLATDPDREGEAIAWHIQEALKLKNPKRIVFNEITKEAVQEAVEHPREIDTNLREAQEARRVLDRLFGYDLSGLIWKKVRYGLSAGRVQSPALRIIMEREREIRAFKSEDFWVITAQTKTEKGNELVLICKEEPRKEDSVKKILEAAKKNDWKVKSVEEKEMKRSPYPPFKTSTLQQRASSYLGFSPSRTMRAAQKLYEKGYITYMRTDSANLSAIAHKQILALINEKYGKKYVQSRIYKTTSKNAQEAHEAIRPTHINTLKAGLTDDEKSLYDLIWKRTIASQMANAKILKTKITAEIKDSPDFAANGSRTLFDGWLKASPNSQGEDVELPKVKEKEKLELINIENEKKETKPPSRYTEAGLIKELEKKGIGRPSTYAAIMRTLAERGYVDKEGKTLFPTDTGEVVSSFLEENFKKYISDSFTAEMENELDEIADGKREYKKTLEDFYEDFSEDVKKKEDIDKITNLGEAPKEFKCPKCGKSMVIKLGKNGKFMSCKDFPNCHGARTAEGKELKENKPIGVDPETELNVYVLEGPYGPYVQLGEKEKSKKPKRGKIPDDVKLEDITLEEALKYVALPRELGKHPETGDTISASIGRFGPYIVHQKDFRSLKEDDVYTIELPRALEILAEEKKTRRRKTKK